MLFTKAQSNILQMFCVLNHKIKILQQETGVSSCHRIFFLISEVGVFITGSIKLKVNILKFQIPLFTACLEIHTTNSA